MKKLIISTLSIGYIYQIYTRYLFNKIKQLGSSDIIFCVTSDSDFSDKLVDSRVQVDFNLLKDHSIDNSRASTGPYRSTVFKYYLKSLAIKNAAIKFPNHSILHVDCDSFPDEKFDLKSIYKNTDVGIYCGEFVTCSGHYGILYDENGVIQINKKIPYIFGNFLKHISEEEIHDLRFPIENKLLFNNISPEKIIAFCDKWHEIGQSINKSGLPTYGDCFEIKASAIINDIQIFKTDSLYFGDSHKNTLVDELKKIWTNNASNVDEKLIESFLQNLPTRLASRELDEGFTYSGEEDSSYSNECAYDAAYGEGKSFFFKTGVTGLTIFNNNTFGDPHPGVKKSGYIKTKPLIINKDMNKDKTLLCELFEKYGSDKCEEYFHTYSPHYYDLLAANREDSSVVIEIGVGNVALMTNGIVPKEKYMPGASLRAWSDFFPNAALFGLDIDTTDFFQHEKIKCIWSDQSNATVLKETMESIRQSLRLKSLQVDLIIDDGSHQLDHMVLSFNTLKHYLKSGGIYIVEDIIYGGLSNIRDLECSKFKIIKEYNGKSIKTPQQDSFIAFQKI
jgi:hypothetical protein